MSCSTLNTDLSCCIKAITIPCNIAITLTLKSLKSMNVSLTEQKIPSPEEIHSYPRFQNLPLENIELIASFEQCQAVAHELSAATLFGFDTESKPTFRKGEVSTGPHLIQLATAEKAYLFQVNTETIEFLTPILASHTQMKVGFGLKNDALLFRKKGIELNNTVDLATCFSIYGFKNSLGVKNAMALLFQIDFNKNKKISTSNWSKNSLSAEQIGYAAADAYAAFLVYAELVRKQYVEPKKTNTL